MSAAPRETHADAPSLELDLNAACAALSDAARAQATAGDAAHMRFDPERVEQDLARLVLAVMEFLRQLMEAQAIRRMDAGRLTPDQEEAVGLTLMRARDKIRALAGQFGLSEDDLSLHLGALGRLVDAR